MTQMQDFMLSVCFGTAMGIFVASLWWLIKDWMDKRKRKNLEDKKYESH